MRLLLGSRSPRRSEILSFFSLPFEVAAPEFSEESLFFDGDPIAFAEAASLGKSDSLARLHPERLIVTADTIVFKDGKLFIKPKSTQEAREMLGALNGSWHSVFTAVTAFKGGRHVTRTEETRVQFHTLDEAKKERYARAFESTDKAGGYGIQEAGSLIVRRIEGCFYNVMGLPINNLHIVLQEMGVDLWDYLR